MDPQDPHDRVLWFVSSLPGAGGGERFVLEASRAVAKQGSGVTIVCDYLETSSDFLGQYNLPIVGLSARNPLGRVLLESVNTIRLLGLCMKNRPTFLICQSEYDAIRLYLVTRVYRASYAVFVFGQTFQTVEDNTKFASIFEGHIAELFISTPGYGEIWEWSDPPKSRFHRLSVNFLARLKRRALNQAEWIWTLSQKVADETKLAYGLRDVRPLPAAVRESDLNRVAATSLLSRRNRTPSSEIRVISISRLVAKKRIDRLLESTRYLNSPVRVDLVGEGPQMEELLALSRTLPSKVDVVFHGYVVDEERRSLLEAADLFVCLDVADFDITVVEALSSACPVVVSQDFDLSLCAASPWLVSSSIEPRQLSQTIEQMLNSRSWIGSRLPDLSHLTWEHLAHRVNVLRQERELPSFPPISS